MRKDHGYWQRIYLDELYTKAANLLTISEPTDL